MKKQLSPFLSLIFATTLVVPSNTRADDLSDFGKGLAIVGAVAAGIGAAVWACSEESDSSLISRAENIYQESYVLKSVTSTCHGYRNFSALPEDAIESLCVMILKKYTAQGIRSTVKHQLRALYTVKNDLDKRIDALSFKHTFEKRMVIDSMLSLRESIINRIDAIEKGIQTFLYYHQEYLELFESEQILHKQYAQEFAFFEGSDSTHVVYSSREEQQRTLKYIIVNKGCSQKYPYSTSRAIIKKDLTIFTDLLKKLRPTRSYPQREKMAYWIQNRLEYMYSLISTSSELERENIQKERDELERRERELEKKKIEKKRKKLEKLESRHARRDYRRV